jgi:hypothetical protein
MHESKVFFNKLKSDEVFHYIPIFDGLGFVRSQSGNCAHCSMALPFSIEKFVSKNKVIDWFDSLPEYIFVQQDEFGYFYIKMKKENITLIIKRMYYTLEDA